MINIIKARPRPVNVTFLRRVLTDEPATELLTKLIQLVNKRRAEHGVTNTEGTSSEQPNGGTTDAIDATDGEFGSVGGVGGVGEFTGLTGIVSGNSDPDEILAHLLSYGETSLRPAMATRLSAMRQDKGDQNAGDRTGNGGQRDDRERRRLKTRDVDEDDEEDEDGEEDGDGGDDGFMFTGEGTRVVSDPVLNAAVYLYQLGVHFWSIAPSTITPSSSPHSSVDVEEKAGAGGEGAEGEAGEEAVIGPPPSKAFFGRLGSIVSAHLNHLNRATTAGGRYSASSSGSMGGMGGIPAAFIALHNKGGIGGMGGFGIGGVDGAGDDGRQQQQQQQQQQQEQEQATTSAAKQQQREAGSPSSKVLSETSFRPGEIVFTNAFDDGSVFWKGTVVRRESQVCLSVSFLFKNVLCKFRESNAISSTLKCCEVCVLFDNRSMWTVHRTVHRRRWWTPRS